MTLLSLPLTPIWVVVHLLMMKVNANDCLFIPSGSMMNIDFKNHTIGETVCNYCSYQSPDKNGKISSNIYECDTSSTTAQFREYDGDSCTGSPTKAYDIYPKDNKFSHGMCIGYKDVMYKYDPNNPESCKGEILSNSTLYGIWGPLNECFVANSVDVIREVCTNGSPIAYIWHPPDYNCTGPTEANVTYNDCTPPYDGHTEKLTLLVNPCS